MYAHILIGAAIGFFAGGIVGSKIDEYRRDESGAASRKCLILGPIIGVIIVYYLTKY